MNTDKLIASRKHYTGLKTMYERWLQETEAKIEYIDNQIKEAENEMS